MAIQKSIIQEDGAVATYHVVNSIDAEFDNPNAAHVLIYSYADKSHYTNSAPTLNAIRVDITYLLTVSAPQSFDTFGIQIINVIEEYLLSLPTFSGGSQVA